MLLGATSRLTITPWPSPPVLGRRLFSRCECDRGLGSWSDVPSHATPSHNCGGGAATNTDPETKRVEDSRLGKKVDDRRAEAVQDGHFHRHFLHKRDICVPRTEFKP